MDKLVSILDSFEPGWKGKSYLGRFIEILREKVIPTYSVMESRIENGRASFPNGWNEIVSDLNEAQVFNHFLPVEYGGKKRSETEIYCLMELLGFASPGLGVIFVSHGRAIDIVLQGNEQQKEEYLAKMAKGAFGAIAMTEDKAGSDPSAIGLMATKADDHYLFKGQKVFISNSGLAQIYAVLVNTKGVKGPRSLSVFIVENDTQGFSIKDLPEKDGLKILPTGRLIFEDSPVPLKNLIGSEEMGLLITLDAIDRGRIHIAGICCGLAYRIFSEISRHTHRRRQFDRPLTSSQDISFQLADMYANMNAARGLCFYALKQHSAPQYRLSSSQAKLFATRMVMDVASKAQILMGGKGYFKNDLINRLSADARGMEYLEGTSNVQKMIIAKELFRMYHKEKADAN